MATLRKGGRHGSHAMSKGSLDRARFASHADVAESLGDSASGDHGHPRSAPFDEPRTRPEREPTALLEVGRQHERQTLERRR
jgi:hypothetical protein